MLHYHAALQTFGLVLCGLTGVLLAEPASNAPPPTSATNNTTMEDHDDVAHQTHA
jgi:hypothetical protein